jgi:predicted enzyme related to lactoylglutathione lyase
MAGEPTYIELGVPDRDTAKAFYGGLFGWELTGPGQADTAGLSIGFHGGDPAAQFEVFFAVDDLDASLNRVRELGGHAHGEIHESPGFGRWAECVDDQGVRFGLKQP